MSDLLFHGLRSVYGETVIDIPKKKHMYTNWLGTQSQLWGRGFSYAKILDDINITRSNPGTKASIGFFDLIVLSIHHTIHQQPHILYDAIYNIKETNPDQKVAVVDGHDTLSTYDQVLNYTPYLFKREIPESRHDLIPISFAIPKEKIRQNVAEKNKYIAEILPADHSHANRKTHSYNIEEEYYNDYASSYFGLTCKKGGWDCMRHYEIMANGCIPIFTDIENCSDKTLTTLPKDMLSYIKTADGLGLVMDKLTLDKNEISKNCIKIDESAFKPEVAAKLCEQIRSYCETFCTTEVLAKYFIGKINAK